MFFDNNLTSLGYETIVDNYLGSFMRNFNGGNSRILQDNSPCHVTRNVYAALNRNAVRWVNKKIDRNNLILFSNAKF